MSDYTYSEIMQMQNDALRRVEEMQKKARKTAGIEENSTPRESTAKAKPNGSEVRRVPMPDEYLSTLRRYAAKSREAAPSLAQSDVVQSDAAASGGGLSEKLKKLLADFHPDSDKALILSLVLLLSEEGADEMLLLSLLYLLT